MPDHQRWRNNVAANATLGAGLRRLDLPGAAHLELVEGVAYLDESAAVFDAMLEGWARQQTSRMLQPTTINPRLSLMRRFRNFTGEYPWTWVPGDVEDFTSWLCANQRAHSTIRGYQNTVGLFCDCLLDGRYGWQPLCLNRFGDAPVQICHEWNTAAHLNEYEGKPARRPMTHEELQAFFDHADGRVQRIVDSGRKGAMAALRDAMMFKTKYAHGLRRRELVRLDLPDLRPNPHVPARGRYGSLHVRYGKAVRGSPPRRRTVLSVPEFDWAMDGLRQWVEQARPRVRAAAHPMVWLTERCSRVSVNYVDTRFAQLRDEVGLDKALVPHCLRHSYITHLIEFGYPEQFVREQVGHRTASATAIHTSVSNDFKNQVLAWALDRVYAPQGGGPR
ncbi:tyrosine-type recombinase/integrase [Streptomyces sp. NBC_00079]|uniref:tyrosine-type recombinase/integrase n=1 Tax=Streptomyces sp. NBC_00079 TaxID=2975644 RepID=UPI00324C67FA